MRARRATGIGSVVVVMVVALGAHTSAADALRAHDANDTRGRLDVRSVSHRHGRTPGRLIHRVTTYSPWRTRRLRGPHNYVWVWFSTDKEDRYAEARAVIDFEQGKLGAWIEPYEEGSDYAAIGPPTPIEVRRANRRSVTIVFPTRLLRPRLKRYSWSVSTSYRAADSTRCAVAACADTAPAGRKRGGVVHRL
jgi:hypothetical protein